MTRTSRAVRHCSIARASAASIGSTSAPRLGAKGPIAVTLGDRTSGVTARDDSHGVSRCDVGCSFESRRGRFTSLAAAPVARSTHRPAPARSLAPRRLATFATLRPLALRASRPRVLASRARRRPSPPAGTHRAHAPSARATRCFRRWSNPELSCLGVSTDHRGSCGSRRPVFGRSTASVLIVRNSRPMFRGQRDVDRLSHCHRLKLISQLERTADYAFGKERLEELTLAAIDEV
jgi:hypothetical protein